MAANEAFDPKLEDEFYERHASSYGKSKRVHFSGSTTGSDNILERLSEADEDANSDVISFSLGGDAVPKKAHEVKDVDENQNSVWTPLWCGEGATNFMVSVSRSRSMDCNILKFK